MDKNEADESTAQTNDIDWRRFRIKASFFIHYSQYFYDLLIHFVFSFVII